MGAPRLYTDEENKLIKKVDNDYRYSLRRNKLVDEVKKTNAEIKEQFITALCALAICDFSHFVTLTFDPKRLRKANLMEQLHDDEIRGLLVHFPDMEKYLKANKPNRQSIDFVQYAATAYFNCLFDSKLISNVLTAIERDKSGRWHLHALVSSNSINIINAIQSKWFYGHADILEIGTGKYNNGDTLIQHREKIIAYMYATFNPTSTSHAEQKRLDYWYLHQYQIPEINESDNIEFQLREELKSLNVHFGSDNPNAIQTGKQTPLSDFVTINTATIGELLKVPPIALFYLITIILLFI